MSSLGFCALIVAIFNANIEFEFYLAQTGNPVHVQRFIFKISHSKHHIMNYHSSDSSNRILSNQKQYLIRGKIIKIMEMFLCHYEEI